MRQTTMDDDCSELDYARTDVEMRPITKMVWIRRMSDIALLIKHLIPNLLIEYLRCLKKYFAQGRRPMLIRESLPFCEGSYKAGGIKFKARFDITVLSCTNKGQRLGKSGMSFSMGVARPLHCPTVHCRDEEGSLCT